MSDPLATLPLSAIRVFEAAARLLSFTRAAEELGMTQAAVSWQVKALERRLDQPLFRRLPREVALTPAGERLARASSEAMTALRSALADIVDTGEGVLSLTTLLTFAMRWLAPRLGGFQVAHPGIAVRVDTDSRVRDLLRGEADLAIRASRGVADPALEAHFLVSAAQTALVSPEAMAALGASPRPHDLIAAPRVGSDAEWAAWFRAAGVSSDGPSPETPRLVADNQVMEVAAALASSGVAIGSPVMFAADIAAGRLVQPFDVFIGRDVGYWLVHARDRRRARKIAAFRRWLAAEIEADPAIRRMRAVAPEP